MNLFIAVVGLIFISKFRSSNAFQCYQCTASETSCKDATFDGDALQTVECDTSCSTATMTYFPAFTEVFQLFDLNSDGSLSTEEARTILTVVGEMLNDVNGTTLAEFQDLLEGYSAQGINLVFETFDNNSDGVLAGMELNVLRGLTTNVNETRLQDRMNNFEPNITTRNCAQQHNETGCTDPVDDPYGQFEHRVDCFCKTELCNRPTQTQTTTSNFGTTETSGVPVNNHNPHLVFFAEVLAIAVCQAL